MEKRLKISGVNETKTRRRFSDKSKYQGIDYEARVTDEDGNEIKGVKSVSIHLGSHDAVVIELSIKDVILQIDKES